MNIQLYDISELLQVSAHDDSDTELYWLGQRGEDAFPIAILFPLKGIICANWSKTMSYWAEYYDIYSLEQINQQRTSFSSTNLHSLLSEWSHVYSANPKANTKPIKILPYMAIKPLHAHYDMLGPKFNLVSFINNKEYQRQSFQTWGFRTPKNLILTEHVRPYDVFQFFRKTKHCIVTPNHGSLGKGVQRFTVDELIKSMETNVSDCSTVEIASEFIEGTSVNTSMLITPDAVLLGWPSLQILGEVISNAPSEFFFCGSSFSATHELDKRDLTALSILSHALGKKYAELGYQGFLGADWILDAHGNWWLIEVNPRMQGSTLALTLFEMQAGYPSLLSNWQPLLSKGLSDHRKSKPLGPSSFHAPVRGFQLNIYANERASLAHYQLSSTKSTNSSEKWYIAGMPAIKTSVNKSAEVFKIIAANTSVSLNNNQLQPSERVKIIRVLDNLKLHWKNLT